jgi:hypothetical protein
VANTRGRCTWLAFVVSLDPPRVSSILVSISRLQSLHPVPLPSPIRLPCGALSSLNTPPATLNIRLTSLHALARHRQSRHLHNTRCSSTPTTPKRLIAYPSPGDGNVAATCALQDCFQPQADPGRLFHCSITFHNPSLLLQHQRRPRQLFDPEHRST